MKRNSLYLVVSILMVLLIAGTVVWFRTRIQSETPPAGSNTGQIGAELITVREFGFEPKQVKRPPGPFLLRVENRSGLRTINLSLVSDAGSVVREIPVTINLLNWAGQVDLAPGKYWVREANHPDWKCQIEIKAD